MNGSATAALERRRPGRPLSGPARDHRHAKTPPAQVVRAVDGLSLALDRGELLAVVGESGCGKSSTARALILPGGELQGTIRFAGEDITHPRARRLRSLRRDIQIVYQDPYESLDPSFRVRQTRGRAADRARHRRRRGRPPRSRAAGARARRSHARPSATSTAFRTSCRVGSGSASRSRPRLVLEPELLIADEPVSMLDVSVRAGILELLERLRAVRPRDPDDHPRSLDRGALRRPDRGDVPGPGRGGGPRRGGRSRTRSTRTRRR